MFTCLFFCGLFVVTIQYFSSKTGVSGQPSVVSKPKSRSKARIDAIKKVNQIEFDDVPEFTEEGGMSIIATTVDPNAPESQGFDQALIIIEEEE